MDPRDRLKRLHDIRSIAAELRSSAPAGDQIPDLSESILGQVDASRPFLDVSTQRSVWVARAASAGCIAIIAASVFATFRFAPEFMPAREPAPLSTVLKGVQRQAPETVSDLRESLSASVSKVALEVQRPISGLASDIAPPDQGLRVESREACLKSRIDCVATDSGAAPFVRIGNSTLVRLRVCGQGGCADRLMLLGPDWKADFCGPLAPTPTTAASVSPAN